MFYRLAETEIFGIIQGGGLYWHIQTLNTHKQSKSIGEAPERVSIEVSGSNEFIFERKIQLFLENRNEFSAFLKLQNGTYREHEPSDLIQSSFGFFLSVSLHTNFTHS